MAIFTADIEYIGSNELCRLQAGGGAPAHKVLRGVFEMLLYYRLSEWFEYEWDMKGLEHVI